MGEVIADNPTLKICFVFTVRLDEHIMAFLFNSINIFVLNV